MAEGDSDKCELIRKRGLVILQGLAGLAVYNDGVTTKPSAWRDRTHLNLDANMLPGVVWLDGGETPHEGRTTYGKAKPDMPPSLMRLEPQVILVEKPSDTVANKGMDVLIAAWRRKIIRAFATDDVLLNSLLGEDGQLEYLGHQTDFEVGGSMRGAIRVNFAMTYMFDVDDLS